MTKKCETAWYYDIQVPDRQINIYIYRLYFASSAANKTETDR